MKHLLNCPLLFYKQHRLQSPVKIISGNFTFNCLCVFFWYLYIQYSYTIPSLLQMNAFSDIFSLQIKIFFLH